MSRAATALEERPDIHEVRIDEAPIPGVKPLEPREATFQRRIVLVVTILPFLGFLAAIWTLWGTGLTALDATIFLVMYFGTGFGVTVGFHRLFTHQSFETPPKVRSALAIAGSMAIQGPVIRWVADHRRHHAFSDQPGDPHSPHLDEGPGLEGVLKGLWHAHIGWFWDDEQTSARRWAPDMVRDPAMRRIDRLFPLWVAISFGAPAGDRIRRYRDSGWSGFGIPVGQSRAHLHAASRDVEHQLDLSLLRQAAVQDGRLLAPTTGPWRSSRSASRGTTTTTRSRPRPCTASRSTRST